MKIDWHNLERKQEVHEERASSILHVFGAGMALCGWIYLIALGIRHGNPFHFLGFFLYGMGVFFLFCMSSLYHGIQREKLKAVFQRLDYTAIYVLIAATYSPLTLILLEKQKLLGWGLFLFMWILAVLGAVGTFLWVKKIGIVNLAIYAVMGLISLCLIPTAYRLMGLPIIIWASSGGLVIIAGVYFFGIAKFRYHHAVWHIFVLAGNLIHFITVVKFLG